MNPRQQRAAAFIAAFAVVFVLICPFVTAAPHNISKGNHAPAVQIPVALLSAQSVLVQPGFTLLPAGTAHGPLPRADRVLELTCSWLC
jgi:hypothetical protein